MNRDELLGLMRKACDDMLETVSRKNADYSGMAADALANFKACENLNLCTAETGAMVRRLDKFMREISFVRKGAEGLQVKDESIEDTFLDDAAYALLLYAIVKDRKASRQRAVDNVTPGETMFFTLADKPKTPANPDQPCIAVYGNEIWSWLPQNGLWAKMANISDIMNKTAEHIMDGTLEIKKEGP